MFLAGSEEMSCSSQSGAQDSNERVRRVNAYLTSARTFDFSFQQKRLVCVVGWPAPAIRRPDGGKASFFSCARDGQHALPAFTSSYLSSPSPVIRLLLNGADCIRSQSRQANRATSSGRPYGLEYLGNDVLLISQSLPLTAYGGACPWNPVGSHQLSPKRAEPSEKEQKSTLKTLAVEVFNGSH